MLNYEEAKKLVEKTLTKIPSEAANYPDYYLGGFIDGMLDNGMITKTDREILYREFGPDIESGECGCHICGGPDH